MKPHAWNKPTNHRYHEIHFLTKESKWEVHLQESWAIATYKADEFKQSLKPVSAFRESKTSKCLQRIKLFISTASLQEK